MANGGGSLPTPRRKTSFSIVIDVRASIKVILTNVMQVPRSPLHRAGIKHYNTDSTFQCIQRLPASMSGARTLTVRRPRVRGLEWKRQRRYEYRFFCRVIAVL
jgi:hypothetical protein